MKRKENFSVLKAVGSRQLRKDLIPEKQSARQLCRPPRLDPVATFGSEQRRCESMTTDQPPDDRVVAGDM